MRGILASLIAEGVPPKPAARAPSKQAGRAEAVYSVGDKVVCAHHGAGTIVRIEQHEVLGRWREYLTIEILYNRMTIMIPVENARRPRLRRVISAAAVDEVLETLRSDPSETMPQKWHARAKRIQEKLGTGDVLEVAEVVRYLALRRTQKELSLGEKQTLAKARKILASEFMCARGLTPEDAAALLEDQLGATPAEGPAPDGDVRDLERRRSAAEPSPARGFIAARHT